MRQRTLGQRLKVSVLGLGCMGMSDFYGGQESEEDSIAVIHKALELGINLLDTADMYGPHTNEVLVGKAIRSRRDKVVLATKFGITRDTTGGVSGVNGRPEYVKSACEGSLKRLGVETIDLYYQHRVDPNVAIEDTVGAMAALVREGKVRHLGLSEASPETLRRAAAIHPITALQSEYSLWTRDPEEGILRVCRELGVGFVAYSPLGRGFLTGRFRNVEDLPSEDYRRSSPRFQGDNFAKNLELVKEVESMAREKQCTASQLALAWVLAQGDDLVPIPGTKKLRYLEENVGAMEVKLTAEDLKRIANIAPVGVAAGPRYSEASMRHVNG